MLFLLLNKKKMPFINLTINSPYLKYMTEERNYIARTLKKILSMAVFSWIIRLYSSPLADVKVFLRLVIHDEVL